MSMIVSKELRIPYILTAMGSDIERNFIEPDNISLIRFLLEGADFTTFVSNAMMEKALLFSPDSKDKFRVIYNSFDPSLYDNIGQEGLRKNKIPLIGSTGTLNYKKGIESLLRAFRLVLDKRKANLLLIGDFDSREKYKFYKLILELKLKGNIKITGFIPYEKVLKYVNNLDVYVQSSIHEGCPISLLEAMYCSKPIVATRVGVANEVLRNGKDALLVEPWDHDGISIEVNKILGNRKLAGRLSESANKILKKKFDLSLERKKWKALYAKL